MASPDIRIEPYHEKPQSLLRTHARTFLSNYALDGTPQRRLPFVMIAEAKAIVALPETPEEVTVPPFNTIIFMPCLSKTNPHAIITVNQVASTEASTAFLQQILSRLQLPSLTEGVRTQEEDPYFTFANNIRLLSSPLDIQAAQLGITDKETLKQIYQTLDEIHQEQTPEDMDEYKSRDYTDWQRLIYLYSGLQFLAQQAAQSQQPLPDLVTNLSPQTKGALQTYWEMTNSQPLWKDAVTYIRRKRIPQIKGEIVGPYPVIKHTFDNTVPEEKLASIVQQLSGNTQDIPNLIGSFNELEQPSYLMTDNTGQTVRILFSGSSGYCSKHADEALSELEFYE